MKKQLLLSFLFLAFLLKVQTLHAQSGYALSLPGGTVTTSKMAVPPLNTLITAYPFTVEMWVKPNAITTAGGFWVDRSGSDVSLQFTNDATGGLRNDIFGTNTNATILANVKPALNVWHHLSFIARSDSVLVECDGIFYAALNTKAFLSTFCSKYSHIGVDSSANNSTRTVNGLFDEVRIWNIARTRTEIQANKNITLAGTETGLIAYYNFDNNNANDKTVHALNSVVTGGTFINLNNVSTLSNINLSNGVVTPTFDPATTIYTARGVSSITATGIATVPGISTVSSPVTINTTTPSAAIICTSGDVSSTTSYTINYSELLFDDWDANGATGAGSFPNMWGWNCSNSATAWTASGAGACRYQDITTGYYFNNVSTPWTGRVLYLRWDGTGGTTATSVFSYPVYLQGCKSYSFNTKYGWVNNSTVSTLTFGFGTDKTGASTTLSDTALCLSTKQYLRNKSLSFTPPSTGVYYLTIKSSTAALCAIADMSIIENITETLVASPVSLFFDESNYQKTFLVTGNALTNDITLVAPSGITLDKTTIAKADAQCGITVTATFNKVATSKDTIRITSGSLLQKIGVVTSADSKCFTPLYSNRTNLVTDPYINDISKFGGCGAKSIYYNTDTAYCGGASGLISGGSLDVVLTGKLKTNTRYRVRAMVKAATTAAQVGVYGWSQPQATKDSVQYATILRSWAPIDFTFKTDAVLETTGQGIFFNNSPGSYIDNWEMYAMPTINAVESSIPIMVTKIGDTGKDTITVFGSELSANITLAISGSKASLFSINKNTIPQTSGKADSTKIAITYSPTLNSTGDTAILTISSTEAQSMIFKLVGSTLALNVSTTSLFLTEANNQKTFSVSGEGLANDITLTAPAGITLDKITIAKADAPSGVTVTATFDKTVTSRDTIRITSGSLSKKICVITSADSKCFTPLYSGRTNLVTDPYTDDLATFGGWGAKSIYYNPDTAYCGGASGLISGGSIDVVLTGILKANTQYRVRAMVKAATTAARVGVYGWSSGQGDINNAATITHAWAPIDFTFKTGAALSATQGIFFNNSAGSYIDNWEMYAMPTIGAVEPTIADMIAKIGNTDKDTITVFGTELSANVTLTISGAKASLFSVDKTSIIQTSGKADSTKVIITYSPAIVSTGDTAMLTISSADAESKVYTLVGSALTTSVKPLISDGITVINRNGFVTVKLNGKTGVINLFDITGKMLLKQIVTTSEQTVNIAKAGIYILKIDSGGITKTVKVVKTY